MTDEPEPYLILHKVRGEPAFDIATLIGYTADGEEMWIIPTSGHSAHPYQTWRLDGLGQGSDCGFPTWGLPEIPKDWPDHYSCNDPSTKPTEAGGNLLDRLGLAPKIERRF